MSEIAYWNQMYANALDAAAKATEEFNTTKHMVVKSATILELCTLLEKAEDAMITARDAARCTDSWAYEALDEPLAAIKQWKEKT